MEIKIRMKKKHQFKLLFFSVFLSDFSIRLILAHWILSLRHRLHHQRLCYSSS